MTLLRPVMQHYVHRPRSEPMYGKVDCPAGCGTLWLWKDERMVPPHIGIQPSGMVVTMADGREFPLCRATGAVFR